MWWLMNLFKMTVVVVFHGHIFIPASSENAIIGDNTYSVFFKRKPALYIRAPSAPPNVCDICDRKLWLSVGGAFSQLLAQSGYKRKLPWARNLISQCC